MQGRASLAAWRALAHPRGDPLVDPPVELLLHALEEALDQLLVVPGPELPPGCERRVELLVHLWFHGATVREACRAGKHRRRSSNLL